MKIDLDREQTDDELLEIGDDWLVRHGFTTYPIEGSIDIGSMIVYMTELQIKLRQEFMMYGNLAAKKMIPRIDSLL
jgi:hypothetical protein